MSPYISDHLWYRKSNRNSIKFSLFTQIRKRSKSLWLRSYNLHWFNLQPSKRLVVQLPSMSSYLWLSKVTYNIVLTYTNVCWFVYLFCHDLAKQLSHYLYISFLFFSFSFILDLLHRRECRKVSHHKCHIVTITWQEVTASHHMVSHDGSYDRHGKIVHRLCSSCISSIENPTGTLSSSLC